MHKLRQDKEVLSTEWPTSVKTTKRVKFWVRIRRDNYDDWRLVECADNSDVPEMCWRTFNKKFWQKHERNELYPCDELAAYQEGCLAMIEAAEKVKTRPEGLRVKPTTYIIAAGTTRLLQFVREEVAPTRDAARQMFDLCRINGAFDIRAWVEALPQLHTISPDEMQSAARALIDATLPRCSADTQRAINALLDCKMVTSAAAKKMGLPRSTFRDLRDHKWFPEFREKAKGVKV